MCSVGHSTGSPALELRQLERGLCDERFDRVLIAQPVAAGDGVVRSSMVSSAPATGQRRRPPAETGVAAHRYLDTIATLSGGWFGRMAIAAAQTGAAPTDHHDVVRPSSPGLTSKASLSTALVSQHLAVVHAVAGHASVVIDVKRFRDSRTRTQVVVAEAVVIALDVW